MPNYKNYLISVNCEDCGRPVAWRYGHDDTPSIPLFCDYCAKQRAKETFGNADDFKIGGEAKKK